VFPLFLIIIFIEIIDFLMEIYLEETEPSEGAEEQFNIGKKTLN